MADRTLLKIYKRQIIIGAIIMTLIVTVTVVGIASSYHGQQKDGTTQQQSAYANIIKGSLNVYHARYERYPDTYQALLDDIGKTRDIYGVNDEGLSELSDIKARLAGFAYAPKSKGDNYEFSFDNLTGSKITVKSE